MIVIGLVVACGRDEAGVPRRAADGATASSDDAARVAATAPPRDAAAPDARDTVAPATLADALAALRADGLVDAAEVIEGRLAQRSPKMKLDEAAALVAARAVLAHADPAGLRALHAVMPRSAVELARAIDARGLPRADAAEIAAYLVRAVAAIDPGRRATFDDNHSHVTGRHWHEIDYRGEGMTWQGQRAYWAPRGVVDFRTAASIHAYFVGAERLPHWRRVYRPRGRVADIPSPPAAR